MDQMSSKRAPSLWILSVASGLSPFGMAIVVPALAGIADRFDASFAEVQFVISAYLFGLAVAQPVFGYLCDRFGRRAIMLIGFSAFIGTSLLCAVAPTLELLIAARFLQAVGVSVGTVASRAILRDTYDRNRMAEAMSYIAAAMGLAPITAPILGGLLQASFGYAAIFVATCIIGVFVLISMLKNLRETLPPDQERPQIKEWFRNYAILLRSSSFVGNTLVFGFVQGSFFSFMAIGALLFAEVFSIQAGTFGVLWGLMALNYVLGATLGAKLTPILGTKTVLHWSIALGVAAGASAWLAASMGDLTVTKVLAPLGFLMLLAGATTPGAMAGAVADHPTRAGTASGLSSAIGLVVGGSFSVLAGHLYSGDYQVIAFLMFVATLGTGLSWMLAIRRERVYSAIMK